MQWRPVQTAAAPVLEGTWLLVTAEGIPDGEIMAALRGHGALFERLVLGRLQRDRAGLAARLREAGSLSGIVSVLALADPPGYAPAGLSAGLALSVLLAQALGDADLQVPVWTLTCGAVSTGPADPLVNPVQAAVWGLNRAVALERPRQWSGLVDLPETLAPVTAQHLVSVLAGEGGEDQVALRTAGVMGRRLVRHRAGEFPAAEAFTVRGTVLITGGTGGLGAEVARWFARSGAGHLVLTSRRGPAAPGAAELRAELVELGAQVSVMACDVADRDALAAVLAEVPEDLPLAGVVHAAGAAQAASLAQTPLEAVADLVSAKMSGAANLDDLLADRELDFFVMFSSVAGVWGSAGQSAYGAANAYLDALAQHRRAHGRPATCVAWGPWAEVGMAAGEATADGLRRRGLRLLSPGTAMAELRRAVMQDDVCVTVADVDWQRYIPVFTAARPSALFGDLPEARALAETARREDGAAPEFAARLRGLAPADQERLLVDLVRAEVAAVLGYASAEEVAPRRAFHDAGFDSLTAVELRKRLTALTGLALPSTIVFDHPNPVALAAHLRAGILGDRADAALPAAATGDTGQPIAIVGMSCRFPGDVRSPEQFRRLLADGVDAISEFPVNRGWDVAGLYHPDPGRMGTTYSTQGGFLHDAGDFDAGFFGISPREALSMDPQQRLLLETTWEAFESAGIDPASVHGSLTGTFVGSTYQDYGADLDSESAGYVVTGSSPSILSGRLAYLLGLEGPAVTVDTACSSSLVALHLACQALRNGEISLALAGGATVMTSPVPFIAFSSQRALAADGRCKAFSEAADGMTLAEGVGILLLERLSDAHRNGHEVLAVVRGSAINSDGASNGLTAPNGASQQRVIRQALAGAGLSPADIDAVEAHGTGTALGDPIEARALQAVYGNGRDPNRPLLLGSVKSNIGHAQSAAGVAGVIKMVLALRSGMVPRTLHATAPSSHIDWTPGTIRLLTEPADWPTGERPRRCAVSSFGISGTNAHTILEQAPPPQDLDATPAAPPGGVIPWVLSARTRGALRAQAANLAGYAAADPAPSPVDIGYSLTSARSLFEHRTVVISSGLDGLRGGLSELAAGRSAAQVVEGLADVDGKVVFIFPGQGAQWAGMGTQLLAESPVFAERFSECAVALSAFVDWSPADVLRQVSGAPSLERVDVVQPVSFATMVSLAALWQSFGVSPDAVIGHSQGEIAGAVVAGALSLDDAARVVTLRSQAIGQVLSGAGAMASLPLPVAEVEERLKAHGEGIWIAAINGPRSVVVSGEPEALDTLLAGLATDDIRARRIAVDYASHSAHVERLRDHLLRVLAPVRPQPARVPFLSTVTGDLLDTTLLDASYWYRNLRHTVRFDPAIRALLDGGHRVFVEVSAHPVLTMGVQATADEAGAQAVVVGTLRRDKDGLGRFLTSLAEAFVRGSRVAWRTVFAGTGARQVALPTYAFQHEHYWAVPAGPRRPGRDDQADAEFWAAVEREDAESLATGLRVDQASVTPVLPALAEWRRRRRELSTVDTWRYRAVWRPVSGLPPARLAGTWLLVTTGRRAEDDVVAALTTHGARVRRLELDEPDTDRRALAARLTADLADVADLAGIVSLLAAAEQPSNRHPALACGLALTVSLIQALGDAGIDAQLWGLTRGAVSTGRSDGLSRPVQAQVLGLGRTAALEHPKRWGGLVDLPENLDRRAGERLAAVLTGGMGEDQLAVRPSGVLARRVVRAPSSAGGPSRRWSPRGTILITGGTGTLAPHLARWFARQGAEHVVLISRSGGSAPGAAGLIRELGEQGCEAQAVACDVTDRDAVQRFVDGLRAVGRAVRTVVHAAAIIELAPLADTSLEGFARVVNAKVTGARHLDELLDTEELDAFILFSSTAGMWGTGQHAAYVAANAYLTALAEQRRARGAPATAISWGIWADDIALRRVDPAQIRRSGLVFMDPRLALAGLRHALDNDESAITIADVDWERYHPVFTSVRPTPLFDEIPEVSRLVSAGKTVADGEFASRLRALPDAERDRVLLDLVLAEAAIVLGHASPDALSERRAFRDVGFDSLTAVDLRNRLAAVTGLGLPSTMVFDYPNPLALTEFLRARLEGVQLEVSRPVSVPAGDEPIAIIGMSCRYPGGIASPEDLWELIERGSDAISEFPLDRGWDTSGLYDPDPDQVGKTYSTRGGFLDGVAEFDAAFFGISPREAVAMDPQQRLLLEASWEVLERAGLDPSSLGGSLTGTFIGASYQDYAAGGTGSDGAEGHLVTGTISSVLSGRLAYTFGFEGPAVTLDTACSSSLVALHLACQSLRNGESTLALAGGVSVMATPSAFIGFSRQRAMAADGRCKAYSDAADGMSLAEGVGLVLVERLSDALRHGHRVLAVVRGSAVNQDGASNGLTAPNGPSQQRVIRQALANAGVSAAEVDVVDGHGTGTRLGDPIEAQALLAVYGQEREPECPLLLGSVKSNIGHTQMASGVASVIKMVMAMRHGIAPKTLHVDLPSSHVDWASGSVQLLTETRAWPRMGRPARAGVSSFGLSGTNVHAVLEQAPDEVAEPPGEAEPGIVPVVLSGRTEDALRAQAGRLLSFVAERPGLSLADLAFSLATSRAGLDYRVAVMTGDRAGLERALAALRDGLPDGALITGRPGRGGPAFLFTGQGTQRPGMGRELYERFPAFAEALDAVLAHCDAELDRPLREIMFAEPGTPAAALLDETAYTQPALFALQVALFRLVESWGVRPGRLAGHSVGEFAAAHAAGVFSLEDACRLVVARGRLMAALPGGGAMVSVQAREDEVWPLLEGQDDHVCIAAVNTPSALVISGDEGAVLRLADSLESQGRRTRRLRVSHAFHSPRMDGMLAEFAAVAGTVSYEPPRIPLVSTVTGELAGEETLCTPAYWAGQVRRTVRFASAARRLADHGMTTFLELGPDGVLSAALRETLGDAAPAAGGPALSRDQAEVPAISSALARLYTHGVSVDWAAVFAGTRARRVDLPTYPFQRQRFWAERGRVAAAADPVDWEFWSAVERADLSSLGPGLALDDRAVAALSSWRRQRREESTVDGWRYRVIWRPVTGAQAPAGGTWLVLTPAGGHDRWIASVLRGLTVETVLIEVADAGRDALAGRIRELAGGTFAGVLSLLAVQEGGLPDQPAGLLATLAAVQALGDAGVAAPLWCVTRGAVSVGRSDSVLDPASAAIWGLGRVVALEHPDRWGGLVDLPADLDEPAVRRLAAVLAGAGGEDQVAVRTSGTYGRRLVSRSGEPSSPGEFLPTGTVLVTGGTGALAGQVARWLAGRNAEHLLLVSRRGLHAPGAAELADELAGLGTRVTVAACDTADRHALAAVLACIPTTASSAP